MGAGYYSEGEWHVIYWTASLAGFERSLDIDYETYINITLWKDLSYNLRIQVHDHIHLRVNNSALTVQPYIKNLGSDINFDLGLLGGLRMSRLVAPMKTI